MKAQLLWAAAVLTLFTFTGHSIGGIKGPPPDQAEAHQVYETMQQTFVTMPFGSPKTLAAMHEGANVCVSFFLLVSGVIFILLAKSKGARTKTENRILVFNSLGMLATGIVSQLVFFPLPAICTGLAGVLGLIASRHDGLGS